MDKFTLDYLELKSSVDSGDTKKEDVINCGDGAYEIIRNAPRADFDALVSEVSKKGTVAFDSEMAGNRFCGISHDLGYTYLFYDKTSDRVGILYSKDGVLAPTELGEKEAYAGQKSLTQVTPTTSERNYGMCYLISLGEGHFIVYDGNGDNSNDDERLFDYMRKGTEEGKKPIIDVWVATHPHWDHLAGFAKFSKKYKDEVELKNILFNLPSLDVPYVESDKKDYDSTVNVWLPAVYESFPQARAYKVHAGQCFNVGGVGMEVLYTHENIYPHGKLEANDTSVITRVYINSKTIFFSADISGYKVCRLLHDMYGSYFKSDVFQVAHHGWNSESIEFYYDVDPETVVWPNFDCDWNGIRELNTTKQLIAEYNEGKRKFYIANGKDDTILFV